MGGREVNMKKGIQQQVRIRIISVACVLLFCGGAIMARLYYLQVVDHEKLASRAASQIHEEIRIAPKRGDISDRHGRKLAVNVEVDSVFGVPSRVEDPHRTAKVLSQATGVRKDLLLGSEGPGYHVFFAEPTDLLLIYFPVLT